MTKWIDELGRPYLQKSHSVGRSIERSTQLLDKHVEFERVCQNTYSNVGKLLENGKSLAKQFPPYHEQIGDKCRQLSGTLFFCLRVSSIATTIKGQNSGLFSKVVFKSPLS